MDKGGSFGNAEVCCPDRFSYEAAMDALSTLISRRKRGDGPKQDDKLERMSMYMKVVCFFLPDSMCFECVLSLGCWVGLQILGLEERVADLKIIHVAGTKGKVSSWWEFVLQADAFLAACSSSPCVCVGVC